MPDRYLSKKFSHILIARILDVLIASLLLIILSPLIFAVAIIIRLKLGKPIIFSQKRPCYRGSIREIYKFRTMTNTCGINGMLLPDSERLDPIGLVLRSLSLDELPQLINVLKGDLSLVGPRPLMPQYLTRYTKEQARRHDVMPGITGWAQIHGRTAIDWEERFKLDLWYVDHYSIWLYLRILCLTFLKVIKREGVAQPDQPTNSEFMGTNQSVNAKNPKATTR